jgi:hypothetical protein
MDGRLSQRFYTGEGCHFHGFIVGSCDFSMAKCCQPGESALAFAVLLRIGGSYSWKNREITYDNATK